MALDDAQISPVQELLLTIAMIRLLLSDMFWDKKIRIAALTLATFAALC